MDATTFLLALAGFLAAGAVDVVKAELFADPCPIHTADEAVTWLMLNGCRLDTYGKVIRVTHRASRKSVVRCNVVQGASGFSLPGHLMMARRDLWAQLYNAHQPQNEAQP
jgi:hypothetical protein